MTWVIKDSIGKHYYRRLASQNTFMEDRSLPVADWVREQKYATRFNDIVEAKFVCSLYVGDFRVVKLTNKKSKMKPFVTAVPDYHDFRLIQDALSHEHCRPVSYMEIGCGLSELHENGYGYYHAVFFTNDNIEIANKIINDWKVNEKIWRK